MKEFLESYGGVEYFLYELNVGDYSISVTDYGATLCTFKYKGHDIVHGFENVRGYVDEVKYMNATIGRVCNRIANGRFILNGVEYNTPINNGPNSLHGGLNGFDTKKWEAKEGDNFILFTYVSRDGEEGYPGNVEIKVEYKLDENGLNYSYEAICDEDTLVNICNHAFFNINGPESETILNDYLVINADKVAAIDADGLTLEECFDVSKTPFDFRQRKQIGKDINESHIQLINGNGYDHHYLINGKGMRHFCSYDNGKLRLNVYSDLPGMHLYSGNYLEGNAHGKKGNPYPRRSSVCFETQYYPNAINLDLPIKPILRNGSVMKHATIFSVEEMENED